MDNFELAYNRGIEYGAEYWWQELDDLLTSAYDAAVEFVDAVADELTNQQTDKVIGMYLGGAVGEAHRQRVMRIRRGEPLND